MADKYYWNFEQNAELWYESGESIEDCIKQAREMNEDNYQTVYIGESVPFVPSEHLNVDVLLDNLEEEAYEFAGEAAENWSTYEYKKQEETAELTDAIGRIVDDWLKKYGRYPTFSQITNVEEYDLYEGTKHVQRNEN